MNKETRHKRILKLIKGGGIDSQAELHKKLGGKVTQATLSRDINELGIIKEKGTYKITNIAEYPVQFGSLLSISPAGDYFLMILTTPGLANSMAELIDVSKVNGILGTVAGDNTILVILAKNVKQIQVTKSLISLIEQNTRRRRSR